MKPKPQPKLVDLAQVLAIVEPFALNQWGGSDVLRKLRALGSKK